MKAFRSVLLAGAAALFAALPLRVAASSSLNVSPSEETLYVKIDSPQIIWFDHYRLATLDASELILTTLRKTATDQARFAGYPGAVTVLDDGAKEPDGAPVLLLTWNGETVNATLMRGSQEKSLGVVSRTPLASHPDYVNMRKYLDKGPHDGRRDALLRASTQMNLYQALRLLNRYQAPT